MTKIKNKSKSVPKSLDVISKEQFSFLNEILGAYQKEIKKRKKVFRSKRSID